jgi:hypothetical protein
MTHNERRFYDDIHKIAKSLEEIVKELQKLNKEKESK